MNRSRAYSVLLILVGAAALLLGCYIWMLSGFHIGHGILVVLGAAGIIWGFSEKYRGRVPKWVRITAAVLLLAEFAFAAALPLYGAVDTADGSEDAIIVLGAGLRGTQVNMALARRLDAALEYVSEHPDTWVVLSGGQGSDEACSEAEAMENYWVEHGGDPEVLILETESESTRENFRFSKQLLEERLGSDFTAACVTTHYHCYRAERLAALEGMNVTHVSAGMAPTLIPANTLRETLAVLKLWLVDEHA